jgi:hypothetical protein
LLLVFRLQKVTKFSLAESSSADAAEAPKGEPKP